jgi:hypothetical protein
MKIGLLPKTPGQENSSPIMKQPDLKNNKQQTKNNKHPYCLLPSLHLPADPPDIPAELQHHVQLVEHAFERYQAFFGGGFPFASFQFIASLQEQGFHFPAYGYVFHAGGGSHLKLGIAGVQQAAGGEQPVADLAGNGQKGMQLFPGI